MVFLAGGGATGAFPGTEDDDDDFKPEGFHDRGGAAFS